MAGGEDEQKHDEREPDEPVKAAEDGEQKDAEKEVEEEQEDEDEKEAEEADSDDDGIELVLRAPEELGQLTDNPYAEDEAQEASGDAENGKGSEEDGAGKSKRAREGGEGNENGEDAEDDDEDRGEEEDGDEEKFKFSHGNKRKRFPKLPGRAGTINAENYTQYHAELGKRNTPFEVDLSQMVDKPWTRMNASLDDFFNFGFNEQSWKEYAARQVALRIHEIDKAKEAGNS
ncbi:Pre-mRNA polyadenylation factor fip1 [Hondaea fermentalgiana]|uniref:Pre-mRNA polyadenylation factor fip1 n=1 Tax=Hondaea fermentalgiana TaxID=2315210 RepID=A0A2R5G296_9STRA|nr:Pre-mRNA polyadenylation factor fip1 [Hondaea fermentalgiana]|eukprot:GBG25130.1 Pre-mRNA polyadenylation factor fip1 [Hondaea fermentalgiana]